MRNVGADMNSHDPMRDALSELVALKGLKDEESRLRQRRECTRLRGSEEARRKVDAMRDDYNRRKPIAWAAARAALSAQPPIGWKLVPELADEPMQKAMLRAVLLRKSMNDVWRAALGEVPDAPKPEGTK